MTNDCPDDAELIRLLYRTILHREGSPAEVEAYRGAVEAGRPLGSVVAELAGSAERVPLFVPPGHFYSPVTDPRQVRAYLRRLGDPAAITALPGIEIDRAAMLREYDRLLPFLRTVPFGAERRPGLRYAFDNPAYSWGDGSVLHAMLRARRPRRLVEVGSGWSSACAIDTIERDLDARCAVTFVEPHPELLHSLVGATRVGVTTLGCPVQEVPLEVFTALERDDILFIDSTHVAKTGSDVCFEILEILPRLRPGVLVHFHDVFWPFEYPEHWAAGEGRSWNELYMLRAFLLGNPAWRLVAFNHYLSLFARDEIAATYPDFFRNPGGALWLTRVA
jgi:predicted O-methyltransferase YrrM